MAALDTCNPLVQIPRNYRRSVNGVCVMKELVLNIWSTVMDNRRNPLRHLDLASQHYFMQVLGWMWSMVFSLSFLSIFQFGITWAVHVILFSGICMTVAFFREAEKRQLAAIQAEELSRRSRCVWNLREEA
jgi:hypothetical protein